MGRRKPRNKKDQAGVQAKNLRLIDEARGILVRDETLTDSQESLIDEARGILVRHETLTDSQESLIEEPQGTIVQEDASSLNEDKMIANLKEVKCLHHKALRPTETRKSLTEEESAFVEQLVSNDSHFNSYTTSLNIDLLSRSLIDFSQDEDLINRLNEVIHFMECDLRSTYVYPGHIVRVGSCRDESRVGRVNEMDTLYVIDTDFTFEWNQDAKGYTISVQGKPIQMLELIKSFATAVETSIQKWGGINPQSSIQHGGFDSPRFSGVRYNGPAVTLLFTYESQTLSKLIKDVSLDMTLAFSLSPEDVVRKQICEQLSIVQQAHTGKIISKEGVHLVPNVMKGMWMMTTAQLEADLFYSLPNKSVLKQAFRFVKIISHDIKKHSSSKERFSAPEILPISATLDGIKAADTQISHDLHSQTDIVNEWLRYAHCFLSAGEADRHNETVKDDVSINTAALKYVLMTEALSEPRYFQESSNTDEDVYLLVVKALEVLVQKRSAVPHSLIENIRINLFSFSKRAVLWESCNVLEAIFTEKCRRILHKIRIAEITSADKIETDPTTNIVSPLKPYLVPTRSIHGHCAAEYFYEVPLDPSISPKRNPKVHRIKMLINGLQNTCGGNVAITTDVIVDRDTLTHWKQQISQCLPGNVQFMESVGFSIQGSVLLACLRVYATELKVYSYEAVNDDQVRVIYFLLSDDGHMEKVDLVSEASHVENQSTFLSGTTPRDKNSAQRIAPNEDTGTVEMANQREAVSASNVHMRRSYSFRKAQDLEAMSVGRGTCASFDQLEIFKESSPVHFTPPLDDLRSLLKNHTVISCIESISKQDALAIVSGDFLVCFDNTLRCREAQGEKRMLAESSSRNSDEPFLASKIADIIYLDTQPVVIFNSIYDTDRSSSRSQDCRERTFEEARVFMKSLRRHIDFMESTEEIFVFPVTHWTDCRDHKFREIKPSTLHRSKLKEGLGKLLLHDNTGFKNMISNEISIYLTGEQIATVQGIELLKFCVVEGPPGSGKTLLEQHLCQRLGKGKCAILCSNKGVRNYINHQGKADAFFIQNVAEALDLLKNRLEGHKYIIIDDAQYIIWEESAWRKVFSMIQSSTQRLFLFMDSRHQIYKGAENVRLLRSLVVEYDGYILPPMRKIYRNSKVIFKYMKCTAMDDDYEETFQCQNPLDGDDAKLTNVPYLSLATHSNGLLTFVRNLLKPPRSRYIPRDVAVLFDVDHSTIGPEAMRNIFRQHWPESRPQTSEIFPVGGIVIDSLDNFLGLESRCVIVVLGDSCDLTDARYKTTVASRAVERLELVKVKLFDEEAISLLHFDNSTMDNWAERADDPNLALMEGELGPDDHPLLHDCRRGDEAELNRQLSTISVFPKDILSQKSRMTPLMIASFWGHLTIVQQLINEGADLETEDTFGRTAVYWADTGGSRSVLKELFTRGAQLKGKRKRPHLKRLIVDGQQTPRNVPKDSEEVSTISVESRIYEVHANDLKFIDNINRGEYGIVDRMLHVPSGTVMAVKRLPYTTLTESMKEFLKDFNLKLRSSDYPYTVLSHGTLFMEGVTWICMEMMDTSLDKFSDMVYTNGHRIPENILAKIAFCVVSALHYLKEILNTIHRDVKPSNILANRKGEVKLSGFGITSHLTDSVSMTSRAVHIMKPYMAPDRISPETGGHSYDIKSDVWSLGIVMLELATGEFPYRRARTTFEMLKQVVMDAPPQLPSGQFSEEFNEFINSCLQKCVNDRANYCSLLKLPFIRKHEQENVDVAGYVQSILDKYDNAVKSTL